MILNMIKVSRLKSAFPYFCLSLHASFLIPRSLQRVLAHSAIPSLFSLTDPNNNITISSQSPIQLLPAVASLVDRFCLKLVLLAFRKLTGDW